MKFRLGVPYSPLSNTVDVNMEPVPAWPVQVE
jgi:hypothetical protein